MLPGLCYPDSNWNTHFNIPSRCNSWSSCWSSTWCDSCGGLCWNNNMEVQAMNSLLCKYSLNLGPSTLLYLHHTDKDKKEWCHSLIVFTSRFILQTVKPTPPMIKVLRWQWKHLLKVNRVPWCQPLLLRTIIVGVVVYNLFYIVLFRSQKAYPCFKVYRACGTDAWRQEQRIWVGV